MEDRITWREDFEALVRDHTQKVWATIYQMVLSREDADDLTQEVFARALRGAESFRRRATSATWLYRIAMNTTRSFLRRKSICPVAFRGDLAGNPGSGGPRPDDAAIAEELRDRVAVALDSLSPSLRAAIVLTATQGFGTREAARIAGCSPAVMYWRIHKARKILREQLGELVE